MKIERIMKIETVDIQIGGVNAGRGDANYCPNCGAKMDEKTDD